MTTRNSKLWREPPECKADPALERQLGLHPLAARILTQRGYTTVDAARAFLDPADYSPAAPDELPDLIVAVEHLQRALQQHTPILIWGDFDVDGQTSTALLFEALTRLGAEVDYYIPHRISESHGILVDSLKAQLTRFSAGLLLTCDTGVSAHEAVDYAKQAGLTVLITDHHDLPLTLPAADAVVNPKRLPAGHPLATLPGAGTAYKLIEHLYTQFGRADELDDFLDLVALGIVVDVAQQTGDTRYLLQRGIAQLRATRRVGLHALFAKAGLQQTQISATDIAFQIGPRLNAAGRLDDARPVVELLTTADPQHATILATQLEALNQQRQLQSRQMAAAARAQIERDTTALDAEAIVLAGHSWHPGIIGLVASQLAEQYQRPAVLLALSDEGIARGSARSAPGYDIGAAIAAQADLLQTFGGHPGAAGLALHEDNIPAFRHRLSETLRATRDPNVEDGVPVDAVVEWSMLSVKLAEELDRLAPFGEGNPPITLAACDLRLRSHALMGRTRQHRRLTVEDASDARQTVLWWNGADQPLPETPFDLAFRLSLSAYRGAPELQLELVDFRRSASAPVVVPPVEREVIDRRGAPDPLAALHALQTEYPGAAVWAEGFRRAESPGVAVDALELSGTLIIYTSPPDPRALRAALERVEPERVILLAVDPPLRSLQDLVRRLLELAKFIINQTDGRTTLEELAAATGHSLATIDAALVWLGAEGKFSVQWDANDTLRLGPPGGAQQANADTLRALVEDAVRETAAYRAYVRRADPRALLGWTETK